MEQRLPQSSGTERKQEHSFSAHQSGSVCLQSKYVRAGARVFWNLEKPHDAVEAYSSAGNDVCGAKSH